MPRKPDLLPDCCVGGSGKRKLLSAVVRGEAAGRPPPWDKQTLATAAGLHPKHTVFRHVEVLIQAEVLTEGPQGYSVNPDSVLLAPLAALLEQLELLPPTTLP